MSNLDELVTEIEALPADIKKHYDAYKKSEQQALGNSKLNHRSY